MEWLAIVVLGLVAWYWLKGKTAKTVQPVQRTSAAVVVPEVNVTFL